MKFILIYHHGLKTVVTSLAWTWNSIPGCIIGRSRLGVCVYCIFTTKFKHSSLDQIPATCFPWWRLPLEGHGRGPPLVRDGAPGRALDPLIGSQTWCRLLQADRQRSVDAVQVSRCSTSTLDLFSLPGLSQFLPTLPSACKPLCTFINAEVEIWSRVKQANWFLLNCRKHLKRSPRQVN